MSRQLHHQRKAAYDEAMRGLGGGRNPYTAMATALVLDKAIEAAANGGMRDITAVNIGLEQAFNEAVAAPIGAGKQDLVKAIQRIDPTQFFETESQDPTGASGAPSIMPEFPKKSSPKVGDYEMDRDSRTGRFTGKKIDLSGEPLEEGTF